MSRKYTLLHKLSWSADRKGRNNNAGKQTKDTSLGLEVPRTLFPNPRSDGLPDKPSVPSMPSPACASTLTGQLVLIQGKLGGLGRRTPETTEDKTLPEAHLATQSIENPQLTATIHVKVELPALPPQKIQTGERTERETVLLMAPHPHIHIIIYHEHVRY